MLIVTYYNEENTPTITVVDENGVIEIKHDSFKIVDAFTGEVIDIHPDRVIASLFEKNLEVWGR